MTETNTQTSSKEWDFGLNNMETGITVGEYLEEVEKKNKNKKRKKKGFARIWSVPKYRASIILLVLLVILVVSLLILEDSFVYSRCEVEAGTSVSITDFLKRQDPKAYFTEDSDHYDVFVPGEYHLKIKTGVFEHPTTLIVKDTIPPTFESHDISTGMGEMPDASECVKNIVDVTKCTVEFVTPPDVSKIGESKATVAVTDLGGNKVAADINVSVWPVKGSLRLEAGSNTPTLEDFMIDGNTANAKLLSNLDTIDMTEVDEIPIKITYKGVTYEPKLIIYDSTPPDFSVKNISSFLNVPREAADFVTETRDNSKVTYTFEVAPELSREGTQNLVIVGTDGGGNVTKKDVTLTLAVDNEAPKFGNVKDIKMFVGRTISYKNHLEVTDNCPEGLKLDVDAASVNTNAAGTYNVTATATDIAGNSTTVSFKVNVVEVASNIDDLNILVDEVLEQIITPGMSVMQKIRAIYDYVYTHCRYRDMNIDGDWIKAAASGFLTGKGDCFTDTCMCRALLTRIGVKNTVINRIKGNAADHYWNLVDIGDGYGWYHLDCLNRMDGKQQYKVFLLTTDEVIKIDNLIGDFHDFDRSKYPNVDPGSVEKTYDFPEATFNQNNNNGENQENTTNTENTNTENTTNTETTENTSNVENTEDTAGEGGGSSDDD